MLWEDGLKRSTRIIGSEFVYQQCFLERILRQLHGLWDLVSPHDPR